MQQRTVIFTLSKNFPHKDYNISTQKFLQRKENDAKKETRLEIQHKTAILYSLKKEIMIEKL